MSVAITLDGLVDWLDGTNRRLENPTRLLDTIGFQAQENTIRRFNRGISPDGEKWDAPGPMTIAARMGKKGGERPLQDTGELAASITYRVEGDVVRIGTPKKYAPVHQEGRMIYAKNAEHLHIPLNPEARGEGPRRLYQRGMFKIRRGGGGIAAINEGGELKPMFALAKQVYVRQRKFLGLSAEDKEIIRDIILDFAGGVL